MIEKEPLINILVRTSGRPQYFKKCIESIKLQRFKNYKIYISYDNKEDLAYIKKSTDEHDIIIFCKKHNQNKNLNFPYNLYFNNLYNQISIGWILFLDDDNKLINNNSLLKISNQLYDMHSLVIWKVKLLDKIIPLNSFQDKPKLYDIDSANFAYNSIHKEKYGLWDGNKCADFRVIKSLYTNLPKTIWIDEVLVESQRTNIYGGKGIKDDLNHKYPLYKKIFFQIKIIIWKIIKRK